MYLLLSTPPDRRRDRRGRLRDVVDRRRRCLGRGLRPVRGVPRAPAPARPVVGRHVRRSSASTPSSGSSSPASPGRPTSAGCSPARPSPRPSPTPAATAGRWSRRPTGAVHWFSMGGILLVLVVLTVAQVRPRRLTARPRRACGLHGCHSSPVGTTPVDNSRRRTRRSAPAGGHEEAGQHQAEADAEVPAPERRDRDTGARRRCSR